MATISYFNLYSLNLSKISDFKNATTSFTDGLQSKFQAAFEAGNINEILKTSKGQLEQLSLMEKQMPENRVFSEMVAGTTQINKNAQAILDKYNGIDPYDVQRLVNCVLGIESLDDIQLSEEIKKNYLLAMKESGFLNSSSSLSEPQFIYQPGPITAEYLSQHPEMKTMTLACGEAGNLSLGACHFRRKKDHAEPSFNIDMTASIGPHVVANMHDPDFWSSIPDGRFENIYDHSYGYYLFEDKRAGNTVQNLCRVLKSGGHLTMDHPFKEEDVDMLQKVGFSVEGKIAKKL